MTAAAKEIITTLLAGGYLRPWKRPGGASCYRMYDAKGSPLKSVMKRTVDKMQKYIDPAIKIFKMDKRSGKIKLSPSNVLKLRRNTFIKTMYKKQVSNANRNTINSI